MKRLPTAREVAAWTKPGRYAVGHGVYLQISRPWNTKAWIFRYRRDGRARHMGLGSANYVTLSEARERGYELRRQLIHGADPLKAKRDTKQARRLAGERAKTFKQCALDYIAAHEDNWRGNSSRRQWIGSLTNHVFPKIGDMPVSAVDVAAVLSVLDPISRQIPETARRIKSRLALVLDWAAARDLRPHDNPAKRSNLLPKRKPKAQHFAALPYTALPSFMVELRRRQEISARALEFAILTAARPGEVLGARWSEVDKADATWTIPGERMKGGKPHRVPLSSRAVELLAALSQEGDFVFPGRRYGGKQDVNSLVLLLRRMGHAVTAHGFRATFRTWAGERTNYPREIIEAALAHVIGDAAEQAYARGDMLARRRRLMDDWACYCCSKPACAGEVVTLRGRQ
jgi:integrase